MTDDAVLEEEPEQFVPLGDVMQAFDDARDDAAHETAASVLRLMRTPPHALDAERALLGGILLDPPTLALARAEGLESGHFYRPGHARVWDALLGVHGRGDPIDSLTIVDELNQRGELDQVGGAAAIAQLEAMLPTSAHVAAYARQVVEAAKRRQIIEIAKDAVTAAYSGREQSAAILRFVEGRITEATRVGGALSTELERIKDEFRRRVDSRRRRWTEPMGKSFADLARQNLRPRPWIVQGLFREESVVVVGGRPKGSKTWAKQEIEIGVATGTKVFGEFAVHTAGQVLTFYTEDDEVDVGSRGRAAARGREMTIDQALGRIRYEARKNVDLLSDDDCAMIILSARRMDPRPVLICIDPLRNTFDGDETNELLALVMRRVQAIRDLTGAAVLLVHHLTKAAAEPVVKGKAAPVGSIFDRFRGGGALRGAWDAGIGFETLFRDERNIKTRVEVEVRQGRGAGVFGVDIEFRDDQWGDAIWAQWQFFKDWREMMGSDDLAKVIDLLRGWEGRLSANAAARELGIAKVKAGELLDKVEGKGLARFFEAGNRSGYEWCGGD